MDACGIQWLWGHKVFTSITGQWFSHFRKNKQNGYYSIGIDSNLRHAHTYMLRQNHQEGLVNYTCSPERLGKCAKAKDILSFDCYWCIAEGPIINLGIRLMRIILLFQVAICPWVIYFSLLYFSFNKGVIISILETYYEKWNFENSVLLFWRQRTQNG